MISCHVFGEHIAKKLNFFAGVPDSLLKSLCAYFTNTLPASKHIIAANEGGAVALAAGHYLATGQPALVYMQNSGIGNAVNPLVSLNDIYAVPVLLIIGWRGEPGVKDEPQHATQGLITTGLMDVMGIEYAILADDTEKAIIQVDYAYNYMLENSRPYALIVKKNTFDSHAAAFTAEEHEILREEAVNAVVENSNNAFIVSTTGMISRELFEIRGKINKPHCNDFLTVGSMGHCSQIALGIALAKPDIRIICMDGDGAVLMHMGGLAIIADSKPANYVHVVFNNGAHDSVGGQPTVAADIRLAEVAKAVGYKNVISISSYGELEVLESVMNLPGPVFIEILVKKGARGDLGRPTETTQECKMNFMKALKNG